MNRFSHSFATTALLAGAMLAGCTDNSPDAFEPADQPRFSRETPEFNFQTIQVPGSRSTSPQGINSAGDVVGGYVDATGKTRGFLLREGVFTSIDVPGAGRTFARGISPDGDIVGNYAPPGAPAVVSHGFLLTKSGDFVYLEFPGYLHTIPQRILPDGTILGCAHNHDTMDSMVGAVMGTRGNHTTSTYASMHNGATPSLDLIAGLYTDMDTGRGEGYVIEKGVFSPLVVPGSSFTAAWDVNPRGDIVGVFQDASGFHGFVRTDAGYTTVDVPGASATRVFGTDARGNLVGTYILAGVVYGFRAERL